MATLYDSAPNAQGKLPAEAVNFRKAIVTKKRCGGYPSILIRPCSMFQPHSNDYLGESMLTGNCSAVQLPDNTTDDEHTCDIWKERTQQ